MVGPSRVGRVLKADRVLFSQTSMWRWEHGTRKSSPKVTGHFSTQSMSNISDQNQIYDNEKDGGCPFYHTLYEPKHPQLDVIPPKSILKDKTCSRESWARLSDSNVSIFFIDGFLHIGSQRIVVNGQAAMFFVIANKLAYTVFRQLTVFPQSSLLLSMYGSTPCHYTKKMYEDILTFWFLLESI